MRFFRIEHCLTGKGPYNSEDVNQELWNEKSSNKKFRPVPEMDFSRCDVDLFYDKEKSYLSGFDSVEQLKKWFSQNEIRKLKNLSFNLYKVKVKDDAYVLKGSSQVAFEEEDVLEKEIFNL